MHERIVKFLLRNVFFIGIGCLALTCSLSDLDGKSTVINPKPTPEFSIPDRIPAINYIYFIAIGDQGKGGAGQRHVARLMNEKASQDSLNFVITLGDNIYNHGVSSVNDPQWKRKFEVIYDLPYLNVPFYPSLGNHDHRNGNARYQVEYSKKNEKWNMPHYYYTFSKRIDAQSSIQFFALDTYVIKKNEQYVIEQLEWLERELQASTATWKVVYGHHPVFSYGRHGHERRMIDLVRPILEKYEVDAYICGHDHDRQLLGPVNGVYYIVSGTGAKSRNTRYGELTIFAETNLGFAWFRISASEFHVQFINEEGKIEYAHTLTKTALSGQASAE
jgi:tartrate-resistant acid phosphatase type 5